MKKQFAIVLAVVTYLFVFYLFYKLSIHFGIWWIVLIPTFTIRLSIPSIDDKPRGNTNAMEPIEVEWEEAN